MKLLLREFIPTDVRAIEALTTTPNLVLSPTASPLSRWVAKCDGQIVAYGDYAAEGEAAFWLQLAVHPAYQQRGIGAALYAHLLNTLLPCQPARLRASAPSQTAARFLAARGFQPEAMHWVKHFRRTGELHREGWGDAFIASQMSAVRL